MSITIDIENKSVVPSEAELCEYAASPLFSELCEYMELEYKAQRTIQYSGDNILPGWNLRFKKAGRTLCTVYPRPGRFKMLLVVGQKEKPRVEAILPALSQEFQAIYNATGEGMGQRWLMLEFFERSEVYEDALRVIKIRRESR